MKKEEMAAKKKEIKCGKVPGTILTILGRSASKDKNHNAWVDCVCDCGKNKTVRLDKIGRRQTVSCGCVKKKQAVAYLKEYADTLTDKQALGVFNTMNYAPGKTRSATKVAEMLGITKVKVDYAIRKAYAILDERIKASQGAVTEQQAALSGVYKIRAEFPTIKFSTKTEREITKDGYIWADLQEQLAEIRKEKQEILDKIAFYDALPGLQGENEWQS